MGFIYDIKYTKEGDNKLISESRYFGSKDDLFAFINENRFELKKYKINWLKTISQHIQSIFIPSKKMGKLNDLELLKLLELLRNLHKNKVDKAKRNKLLEDYVKNDKRFKNLAKVMFIYSQAIDSGYPIDKALDMIGVPKYISESVKLGHDAGEATKVYNQLIDLLKTKIKTKKKINQMLIMPKITIFFLYGYFLVAMFLMIPKTKELLAMMEAPPLPPITQMLYDWSTVANEHPVWFVLGTLTILIVFYKLIYWIIAKSIRYIPYVKDVYKAQDYVLITALIAISQSSRIPLSDGIDFAASVVSDPKLKNKLLEVADLVSKGNMFSKALEEKGFHKGSIFDKDFRRTVDASENSGNMSEALLELHDEFKEELDNVIASSSQFINPIVIIFIASVIIIIYYGVNAPLFSLGNSSMKG